MAIKLDITRRRLALFLSLFLAESLFSVHAADPNNGAQIYNMHCISCHGNNGSGAMPGAPNFLRGEGLFQSDSSIVTTLENGTGVMPAYRGLLTTQDLLDVVAYLRTLH